jgi:hypothetical protein
MNHVAVLAVCCERCCVGCTDGNVATWQRLWFWLCAFGVQHAFDVTHIFLCLSDTMLYNNMVFVSL